MEVPRKTCVEMNIRRDVYEAGTYRIKMRRFKGLTSETLPCIIRMSFGTPEHGILARDASVQVFLLLQYKKTPGWEENQDRKRVPGEKKEPTY